MIVDSWHILRFYCLKHKQCWFCYQKLRLQTYATVVWLSEQVREEWLVYRERRIDIAIKTSWEVLEQICLFCIELIWLRRLIFDRIFRCLFRLSWSLDGCRNGDCSHRLLSSCRDRTLMVSSMRHFSALSLTCDYTKSTTGRVMQDDSSARQEILSMNEASCVQRLTLLVLSFPSALFSAIVVNVVSIYW